MVHRAGGERDGIQALAVPRRSFMRWVHGPGTALPADAIP